MNEPVREPGHDNAILNAAPGNAGNGANGLRPQEDTTGNSEVTQDLLISNERLTKELADLRGLIARGEAPMVSPTSLHLLQILRIELQVCLYSLYKKDIKQTIKNNTPYTTPLAVRSYKCNY